MKLLFIHLIKSSFTSHFITQLELLSFKNLSSKQEQLINELISECVVIDLNNEIKQLTIEYRKRYKLKLPDCLVAATAQYMDLPLITADADFKKVEELNLIYYER